MKQLLLSILMLLPLAVIAEVVEKDGLWYNLNSEDNTAEVVASQDGMYKGDKNIPSYLYLSNKSYRVTSIGESAFEGCTDLTSITLPTTLRSIEKGAFYECSGLTSIRIPNGVTKIGLGAFSVCYNMECVIIPKSVTTIESYAFDHCPNLNCIVSEGENPIAIDNTVFESFDESYSVYAMATLVVPDGSKSAYQATTGWSFSNISEASERTARTIHVAIAGTLPNYISDMEKYQIEELTLTGELNGTDFKLIRDMAGITFFFNARSGHEVHELKSTDGKLISLDLTSAKIVKGGSPYLILDERPTARPLTRTGVDYEYYTENNSITSRLFADTKLVSIIIPSSITSINLSAFSKSKLTSIAVGQGNQYYDSRDNCNAIIESNSNRLIVGCKSTIIPYSVESIGASAFYGCSGLTSITIPNSVKSIGGSAFMKCSGLTSITIPSSVESIGGSAFYGCSGLTSITIPNSVTSIGDNAFYDCSGLASIIVESGNQYYDSRNNCNAIIEKTSNTLIVGCKNTTIPNNVKSIGNYAFNNCSGLTSVTIPNSVTSIGNYAFNNCSGLTSVTIPNSVTSIGDLAFYGCSGLTSVAIGNSVASIGQAAFSGCSSLKSVHISDMKAWCGVSFYYSNSNPLECAHHLYLNGKEVKNLVIPDGVTTIGRYAFYGCSGLETVTISNSVKSIGERAFQGCSGLITVSISDGVTSIGICAFSDCNGLTSVTIGNSVETIGKSAFYDSSALTSILSLNNTPPTCDGTYVFNNVDKENCVLWVPKGSVAAYWEANGWKDFQNIKEIVDGDVNLDEKVNRNDQNALVAHIMGKKPEGFYEGLADLNGDDDVNAADVVKLIDVIGSKGLSTETEFGYDNVGGSLVVLSLTCTLNNERDEAILLTRCELYSNGSLLRTKSFSSNPVSIAAGGNKSCTFENLSKPANGTDFSVCWHYMVDDESFVYRCPLAD